MSKFFKTAIIGAVSGAAAAYFLNSDKGKELKNRAEAAYEGYRENPEAYHQKAKEKTSEYGHLAVDTFNEVKEQFEAGELTPEQMLQVIKDKANQVVQKTKENLSEVSQTTDSADDIIITLDENDIVVSQDVPTDNH